MNKRATVIAETTRGIDWAKFNHARGYSCFHKTEQHLQVECDVVLEIDEDALIQLLLRKAAWNKTGKSTLAAGRIKLKVVRRNVLKDERTPKRIPEGYVEQEAA